MVENTNCSQVQTVEDCIASRTAVQEVAVNFICQLKIGLREWSQSSLQFMKFKVCGFEFRGSQSQSIDKDFDRDQLG